MTQTSILWNGVVTGDATLAPYDKELFNTYMMGMHVEDTESLYVIPGYLNDLEVVENGSRGATLKAGAAVFGEYLYIIDADISFACAPPASGNFRYDLIVLEIDRNAQTVRAKLIKGSDTTNVYNLTDPVLTMNQQPLARLFVSDDYTLIEEKHIYDVRQFAITNFSIGRYGNYKDNLVVNGEWLAFSSSDGSEPPEMWNRDTSYAASTWQWFTSAFVPAVPAARGGWLRVSESIMYQDFNYNSIDLEGQAVITVKGSIYDLSVSTGATPTISLAVQNDDVNYTIIRTQEFPKINPAAAYQFQFTVAYDNNEDVGFRLLLESQGDWSLFGPVIVVPGYHPGPLRAFSEMIPFNEPIPDSNWTATAKSTGTTAADGVTWGTSQKILLGTRALILKLRANDSGSAAGTPYLLIQHISTGVIYGIVYLQGLPNDTPRESRCIVPINSFGTELVSTAGRWNIGVSATGAGTLDATVEIIGIIT